MAVTMRSEYAGLVTADAVHRRVYTDPAIFDAEMRRIFGRTWVFVGHESEGRAHRYFPMLARQAARRSAVSRLVAKLFHGSPEQLVAHLVEERDLSAAELQRLRKRLGTTPSRRPRGKP